MRNRRYVFPWASLGVLLTFTLILVPTSARADNVISLSNGAIPLVVAEGGLLSHPYGLAFSPQGELYVSNTTANSVIKVGLSGGTQSTFASGFPGNVGLRGLAFDSSGNLYGSDVATETIQMFTPQGVESQYADFTTAGSRPMGLTYDQGNLYSAASGIGSVYRVGTGVLVNTGINYVEGITHDVAGNLFFTNGSTGTVFKLTLQGTVSVVATGINNPVGIAADLQGNLYISSLDTGVISKITSSGTVSTFASGFTNPEGLAIFDGNLFVANSGTNSIVKLPLTRVELSSSQVRAIPGDRRATISWVPVPIDPRALFVPPVYTVRLIEHSYTGYWNGGPSCTTSRTSCIVRGLTNGQTYWVNVTETTASGYFDAFHATTVTPVSIAATTTTTSATESTTTSIATTTTVLAPVRAKRHHSGWTVYWLALSLGALLLLATYIRRLRR
jgi:glucose/arabinose dehydrogenase